MQNCACTYGFPVRVHVTAAVVWQDRGFEQGRPDAPDTRRACRLGRAFRGAVRGFAATAAPAAPRPSSTAWRYISLLGSRPCSLSLLTASSSVCT